MTRLTRRTHVTVLLAALVATTGCIGGFAGGGDDATTRTTTEASEMATTTGTTADSATTEEPGTSTQRTTESSTITTDAASTTTAAAETDDVPRFAAGESYAFRMEFGQKATNLTWKTVDVSGDQVTANVSYETPEGAVQTETLRGTQRTVTAGLSYPKSAFDIMRSLQFAMAGHSLDSGNAWTEKFDNGTTEFEVIGTDTVDGVPCTVVRGQDRGATKYWELCVSQDHPFLLSAVQFDQSGTAVIRIVVTDHP